MNALGRCLVSLSLLIFLVVPIVFGQKSESSLRKHELFLQVDNDAFAFTHFDRYYTHGVFLGYNQYLNENERIKISFVQQIYTPEKYTVKDIQSYDRPYAGVLYGRAAYQRHFKRAWLEGGMLLGKIGPGSKAAEVQLWYHRVFGFPQPQGWDFQIRSGGLINFQAEGAYQFFRMGWMDFWILGRGAVGNFDQSIQVSPRLRLGDFLAQGNGFISGSRAGHSQARETYLLLGANLKRVYKNATLQGTEGSETWDMVTMDPMKMQNEYFAEMVLGLGRYGVSYRFSYRTQETSQSEGQLLGSLRFSYLF